MWRADLCSVLWPLSSEGSLVCHTHCDTGHLFIMVISEDQWHSHPLLRVYCWAVELSLPVFMTKVCCGWDSNTQPAAFGANALTHSTTAAVTYSWMSLQPIGFPMFPSQSEHSSLQWKFAILIQSPSVSSCKSVAPKPNLAASTCKMISFQGHST